MRVFRGNLLYAQEQYIAHQCNCVSDGAKGLAASIFKQWPTANVYKPLHCPKEERRVGNILVNQENCRPIIAMFAQYFPGPPSNRKVPGMEEFDDAETRLSWFQKCLTKIVELNPESVAFPYAIGCGLAKGEWPLYEALLKKADQSFRVVLYRR